MYEDLEILKKCIEDGRYSTAQAVIRVMQSEIKKEWVGLDDDDVIYWAKAHDLWGGDCAHDVLDFAASISDSLRRKNT